MGQEGTTGVRSRGYKFPVFYPGKPYKDLLPEVYAIHKPFSEQNPMEVMRRQHPTATRDRYTQHECWEWGMVLEGSYCDIRDNRRRDLGPGQMWWGGPWELHGWKINKPGTSLLVVEFIPAIFQTIPATEPYANFAYVPFLFPGVRPQLQPGSGREKATLLRYARGFLQKAGQRGVFRQSEARLEFLLLQIQVFKRHPLKFSSYSAPDHTTVKQIMAVVDYVRRHPTEKTSLEKGAEQACLGRTLFSQTFKRVTGASFGQYVQKARLEKAHLEIIQGGTKIAQIARQCGFSLSHFIRIYTKHFGRTPGRERRGR